MLHLQDLLIFPIFFLSLWIVCILFLFVEKNYYPIFDRSAEQESVPAGGLELDQEIVRSRKLRENRQCTVVRGLTTLEYEIEQDVVCSFLR